MRISDWSSDVCSSDLKAFTQEARLQSTDPNAAFSWTAGVFYQNVRQRTQQDIVSPLAATFIQLIPPLQAVFGAATPLPGDRPYASADRSKDTQIAGFGQIDWRATEQSGRAPRRERVCQYV